MPFITVKSLNIPYRLRRSLRAKRLQMALRQQQIEIVAPPHISNQMILQFLFSQQNWLYRQTHRKRSPSLWPSQLLSGEAITFRANHYFLNIKYAKRAETILQDSHLLLKMPWRTRCEAFESKVKIQIIKWYQQEAKVLIEKSLQEYCPKLGRWPRAIKVKQQKTRWGSCGIDGNININWLLVLAPPGVLEYVVVHELCHLFYRNHGVRFWQKLADSMPDFKQYENWLSRHGHSLQGQRY